MIISVILAGRGRRDHMGWIYNYISNQCLSLLSLWVWIPLRWDVLDTSLCDKVCQLFATGRWFSLCTPVSSTNKTDCQDITEILLKVALNPKIFIKSLQEEKLLLKVALNPKIFIKNLQEEKLLLKVALNPKIFIKNRKKNFYWKWP